MSEGGRAGFWDGDVDVLGMFRFIYRVEDVIVVGCNNDLRFANQCESLCGASQKRRMLLPSK